MKWHVIDRHSNELSHTFKLVEEYVRQWDNVYFNGNELSINAHVKTLNQKASYAIM